MAGLAGICREQSGVLPLEKTVDDARDRGLVELDMFLAPRAASKGFVEVSYDGCIMVQDGNKRLDSGRRTLVAVSCIWM